MPVRSLNQRGQSAACCGMLHLAAMPSETPASSAKGSSLRRCSRSRSHSLPMLSADQARPAADCSATTKRRGVTPLVTLQNFSGHNSCKIPQDVFLQQIGMERGHAVDRVAADAGQIGHAHMRGRPSHRSATCGPRRPSSLGKSARTSSKETAVDFIDDLQMPRQQAAQKGAPPISPAPPAAGCDWCSRKCVGVIFQACIPIHVVLVHQQAHQFGDRDGRMGVVELYGEFLVKLVQARPAADGSAACPAAEQVRKNIAAASAAFCPAAIHRWDRALW